MKLNERQDKEKATNLCAKVKESIRRWNKADVFLFNYFLLMKRFGEKLRWKDQAFSKITRIVENYIVCNKHVNNMQIVKQIL